MIFPSGFNETSIFADVTVIETICNSYASSQAQFQIVSISASAKMGPLIVCSKIKNMAIESYCRKFYAAYVRCNLS